MINMLDIHAKEKVSAPVGWEPYFYQCLPKGARAAQAYEIRGAVAPKFTRGPRKGHTNFKRMDKTTVKTAIIGVKEHLEWIIEWEHRTGKCAACGGDGVVLASCDTTNGIKTRECMRCKGTGVATIGGEGVPG